MNKREVFKHFSDIFDDMLYHSLFWDTYFQSPYSMENASGSIDDIAFPENLSMKFGATRGCLIDTNYDYVVKFDIEGDANGYACEREEYLYDKAIDAGIEQYFAECVYLGTYTKTIHFYDYCDIERNMNWCDYDWREFEQDFMENEDYFGEIHNITISIPLYAYPKARPHYFMGVVGSQDENEYICKAQKIVSPMRDSNLAVAVDFIRQYGEEAYQRVTDFLYENDINDLHCANFADIDGHYVAIDYAGYHDCYSTNSDY